MKRPHRLAVLKDRKGDLRKQWYVEFWVWKASTEKIVRKMHNLKGKYHWPFIRIILKHASILKVASQFFEVNQDKAGCYFHYGSRQNRQVIELDLHKDEFQSLTLKNTNGDVIQFLMVFKHMSFIEAVCWLGEFYRLLVDQESLVKEAERRTEVAQHIITDTNILLKDGYHISDLDKKRPPKQRENKLNATFRDAFTIALEAKLRSISKGSVGNYKSTGLLFLDYLDEYGEATLPFHQIESQQIIGFLDWCQEAYGISNTTRNNRLSTISAVITHMRSLGYREKGSEHPCKEINYEKTIKRKNFAFNSRDRDAIFNHLYQHDKQLFLACSLIYYLFLRINEMRALKVERFNWREKTVFIRPENKTYRPRYPDISDGLEEILDGLDFKEWNPKHFVFSKNGASGTRPIHKDSLSSRFRTVLIRLDIDPSTHNLYSMKHTGNIDSFNAKVSLESLRQQNGHSTVATTVEYLKELGAKFDSNLAGKQPRINLSGSDN